MAGGENERAHGSETVGSSCIGGKALPLGELERLAGPLLAVLLAFLHAAVAGEVAGVAELLGEAARGGLLAVGARLRFGRAAEHALQGAGDALAAGARLAGEAAALDADMYV